MQFGLQFEVVDDAAASAEPAAEGAETEPRPATETLEGRPRGSVPVTGVPQALPAHEAGETPIGQDTGTGEGQNEGGATIVRLDTFRKK